MDSGCVEHVTNPASIPSGVKVVETVASRAGKGFTAANGGRIENYGAADVEMVMENNAAAGCCFQVADVNRTLQSVAKTTDEDFDVLFTKRGAVVVKSGILDKHVTPKMTAAKFQRTGNLYTAKVKVRAPKGRSNNDRPGFTRQGNRR